MKRTTGGLLVAILIAALAGAGAQTPPGAPGDDARTIATLRGTASNGAGAPVAGVTVKIFEEGFLIASGVTDPAGAYEVEFGYLPDLDWTMVVWYLPPTPDLVPEIAVLRESFKSKEMELWSICLPRSELRASMKYDVTLLTEEKKLEQMSELDCLRQ